MPCSRRARRQDRSRRQRRVPADRRARRADRGHLGANRAREDAHDRAEAVRAGPPEARGAGELRGRRATATSSACPRPASSSCVRSAGVVARCAPLSSSSRATSACTTSPRSPPRWRAARARRAAVRLRPRAPGARRRGQPRRVPARRAGRSGRLAAQARRGTRACARATSWRRRCAPRAPRAREAVFVSEDVSAYAQARERRLGAACEQQRLALSVLPGVTVVPPGELAPAGARVLPGLHAVLASLAARAAPPARADAAADRAASRLRARPAARARRARTGRPVPGAAARRRSGGAPPHDELAGSRPRAATTACTTISRPTARHGSARSSTSAASRRSSWPSARAAATARSPSCASSPGGTSTRSCSRRARRPRGSTSVRAAGAGATTKPRWRRGRTAAPASRSSTPGCASSRARASCTTARGCSPPRS